MQSAGRYIHTDRHLAMSMQNVLSGQNLPSGVSASSSPPGRPAERDVLAGRRGPGARPACAVAAAVVIELVLAVHAVRGS
jgi:hypothetical protein